jgi:hypothetical protein
MSLRNAYCKMAHELTKDEQTGEVPEENNDLYEGD